MGGHQINTDHAVILIASVAVVAIVLIFLWAAWPRRNEDEQPPPGRHRKV